MKNSIGRMALLLTGLGLVGCGDLFNANFERDMAGSAPTQSPAGAPGGDSILASPGPNFLVTSKMGIAGRKAFAFVGSQGASGPAPRTIMRSARIDDLETPVEISWQGTFGNGGGVTAMLGYLGKPYVQIAFSNGDISVEGAVVGAYLPGHHHQVAVRLFPIEERYQIEISGDPNMSKEVLTGAARLAPHEAGNQVIADFVITQSIDEQLVYVIDEVRMNYVAP